MDEFERASRMGKSSRNNSNNARRHKFNTPTQEALQAFVTKQLGRENKERRQRLDAQGHGVGRIADRRELPPPPAADPLNRGRSGVSRSSTIRAGFERSVGTLRKSGRRVRKKAADTRRSLRRATKRPVIPYSHLRRIQADETIQRNNSVRATAVSSVHVFTDDHPVPALPHYDDDITNEHYTTWLRQNSPRLRPSQDRILRVLLPSNKERKKFFETYGSLCSCRPPPLFMVLAVILQASMYIWYYWRSQNHNSHQTIVLDTMDSMWIYDPRKRDEVYRFLTYAILHKDIEHLLGNLGIQLVIGFLLELVYKWRIFFIYFIGIISGSLASSIFDPHIKLIGSSGGSYALIGAYIIMFLRRRREFPRPLRWFNAIMTVTLIAFVTFDFYMAYNRRWNQRVKVSHVAHIAGLFSGWTIGYTTLWSWKNKVKTSDYAPYLGLIISLCVYFFFVIGAILYNVAASPAGSLLYKPQNS